MTDLDNIFSGRMAKILKKRLDTDINFKNLVSNLKNMTEMEILNLSEKKAIIYQLIEIRKTQIEADIILRAGNSSCITYVDPQDNPDKGDVYFMNSDSYWLKYGQTKCMQIEIKYGDLLFIRANPIMSFDHITADTPLDIKQHCVLKETNVDYLVYRRMVADRYNNMYPDAPVILAVEQNVRGLTSIKSGNQFVFRYNN